MKSRVSDQHRGGIGRDCDGRKVRWKVVLIGDAGKGRIENAPAFRGIRCARFTDRHGHQPAPVDRTRLSDTRRKARRATLGGRVAGRQDALPALPRRLGKILDNFG